jgi:hypothetical protein
MAITLAHGIEGIAARASGPSLEAASPMISIARISANSSILSPSRSMRWRPTMKLRTASAASIMCRTRTASSACILDLCGAHDLVAEIAAEILRGPQVHAPVIEHGR